MGVRIGVGSIGVLGRGRLSRRADRGSAEFLLIEERADRSCSTC